MSKTKTDQDTTEAKSSGSGMMGMIAVCIAAIAGSFGVSFFLGGESQAAQISTEACASAQPSPIQTATQIDPDQRYVELKEIVITVGSAPAKRYLKLNTAILTDKAGESTVKNAEPLLTDAFNTYLRSIELSDFEDPGFYPHLKEQLARRAELVLGAGVSDGVLITEFMLR